MHICMNVCKSNKVKDAVNLRAGGHERGLREEREGGTWCSFILIKNALKLKIHIHTHILTSQKS